MVQSGFCLRGLHSRGPSGPDTVLVLTHVLPGSGGGVLCGYGPLDGCDVVRRVQDWNCPYVPHVSRSDTRMGRKRGLDEDTKTHRKEGSFFATK